MIFFKVTALVQYTAWNYFFFSFFSIFPMALQIIVEQEMTSPTMSTWDSKKQHGLLCLKKGKENKLIWLDLPLTNYGREWKKGSSSNKHYLFGVHNRMVEENIQLRWEGSLPFSRLLAKEAGEVIWDVSDRSLFLVCSFATVLHKKDIFVKHFENFYRGGSCT